MVTAYLSLGSNLGRREATLAGARALLSATPGVAVTASSALYETDPVGGPEGQGPYLNAVLRVETALSPRALLQVALDAEAHFGRRRAERWGARTLDVDLLLYGGEVRREADLVLPHPRLHLRRFVLDPLCDLAPGLPHPLLGRTARDLRDALPADGVRRLAETW